MNRTATILLATILAAGAVAPGVAAAEDPYKNRPQVVVRIADLNLERPADQAEMVKRVERAARAICSDAPTLSDGAKCASETIDYTLSLSPPDVRRAFEAASTRHETFAIAQADGAGK